MRGEVGAAAVLAALVLAAAGAVAAAPGEGTRAEAAKKKPNRYASDELFIETNATDGDAGLQSDLDGEDWRVLKIKDPSGKVIVDVRNRGRLRDYGLTGLTFESAEPGFDEHSFAKFKRRFPEGRYKIHGRTVEGRRLVGSDLLTHTIPKIPTVLAPLEGSTVSPDGFDVSWEPVTKPEGVEIARYLVIVTQEGPERELSMVLTGEATSASIPGEFLKSDTETKVEVLARERSGNQTIAEIPFRTGS